MTDTPEIAYWCGQPLRELSREELEAALCYMAEENERLLTQWRDSKIAEVRALSEAAKSRNRGGWLASLFR